MSGWARGRHADPRGAACTVRTLLERAVAERWPVRLNRPRPEPRIVNDGARVAGRWHTGEEYPTGVIPRELIAALDARKAS